MQLEVSCVRNCKEALRHDQVSVPAGTCFTADCDHALALSKLWSVSRTLDWSQMSVLGPRPSYLPHNAAAVLQHAQLRDGRVTAGQQSWQTPTEVQV